MSNFRMWSIASLTHHLRVLGQRLGVSLFLVYDIWKGDLFICCTSLSEFDFTLFEKYRIFPVEIFITTCTRLLH
jgi:hypothetical protein